MRLNYENLLGAPSDEKFAVAVRIYASWIRVLNCLRYTLPVFFLYLTAIYVTWFKTHYENTPKPLIILPRLSIIYHINMKSLTGSTRGAIWSTILVSTGLTNQKHNRGFLCLAGLESVSYRIRPLESTWDYRQSIMPHWTPTYSWYTKMIWESGISRPRVIDKDAPNIFCMRPRADLRRKSGGRDEQEWKYTEKNAHGEINTKRKKKKYI